MKLLLLSLGYIISLLIFQSGFLLKRQELHLRSSCHDARVDKSGCWMEESYQRVILVVIDALRYDFIAPSNQTAPYLGQMKFAESLLSKGAFLSPVIADPPTTTLQRLKALTTGTLPTFIDASDNFSPDAEIHEDNIIDQLIAKKKNITLLGDDTWISLFPSRFHRQFAMPSFDVHDLHTVDNEIIDRLPHELSQPNVQLLIAHFLGVDHCGHRYGPSHPEMTNKLRQMDRTLQSIVSSMSSSDLLIVLGDHGMTSSGDHGGDSTNEITAGLMVYSPSHSFPPPSPFSTVSATSPSSTLSRSIRQIDLLPSLSLLLGVPIPFSNLGTVIHELFLPEQRNAALQLNYEQIMRFTNTYASANPFALSDMPIEYGDETSPQEQLESLSHLQAVLRSAWTQFDHLLIIIGLASFLECLLFNLSFEPSSFTQGIVRSGLLLLQMSTYFGGSSNIAVPLLEFTLSVLIIFHVIRIVTDAIALHYIDLKKAFGVLFIVLHSACFFSNSFIVAEAGVVRYLIQLLVVASVVKVAKGWDKKMTGGDKFTWKQIANIVGSEHVMLSTVCLCLLRLEPISHRCREEEEECVQYFPTALSAALSGDARLWRLILGVFCAIVLNWLFVKEMRRMCDSRRGDFPSVLSVDPALSLSRALSWPSLALLCLNWAFNVVPYSPDSIKSVQMGSAWGVYLIFTITLLLCLFWPKERHGSISRVWCCLHSLIHVLSLLLGEGMSPALLIFVLLIFLLPRVVEKEWHYIVDSLLISFGFYFLGHSPTLTALPWTAAFVGIPGNFPFRIVPATLVVCHLFSATLLVTLRLCLQNSFSTNLHSLLSATAYRTLCACAAAAILRRHLMVWKIFAPRFIFEAVSLIVLILALCTVSLMRKRLST